MAGLFRSPRPPQPKPVRLPVQDSIAVEAARERARRSSQRRNGRLSTVLTDSLRSLTGSLGKLGR